MELGNYKESQADLPNPLDRFNNLIAQNRFRDMLNDGQANTLVALYSRSNEIVLLIETYLALWDYRVKSASNKHDLFEILKNEFPAAVLFDLPYEYGGELELLQQIRKSNEFRRTPILVLSGHARRRDADSAYAAGADEYFIKPINFDYLESRLNLYSFRNLNQNSLEGTV